MPYFIYRLVSPSGKSYIGITKDIEGRWRAHKRKARIEDKRHPLYDAIRSYGPDSFKVESLLEFEKEQEAIAAEILVIELFQATNRKWGYNISLGGEYDGATGSKLFWDHIRKDPAAYEAYIKNLSEGCKKRGALNIEYLIAYNRALPAKERWKLAHRASRVAARLLRPNQTGRVLSAEHIEKMRAGSKSAWENKPASKKRRHSMTSRQSALAQWNRATPEVRAEIFDKISDTLKARHASDTDYHEVVTKQLSTARQNIDRSKQGPAASRGLKQYWIDLKKDPERYAEYMRARSETLKATLKKKEISK